MMNKGAGIYRSPLVVQRFSPADEVLNPSAVRHSLDGSVIFDGSVIAQLGEPDMRTPYRPYDGLHRPRLNSGVPALDFCQLSRLSFSAPDYGRYPCLKLAMDAFASRRSGGDNGTECGQRNLRGGLPAEEILFTDIAGVNHVRYWIGWRLMSRKR